MDYSRLETVDLDDMIRGQQDEIAALRQQIAGMEYELRQAHRELERRLKRPVGESA